MGKDTNFTRIDNLGIPIIIGVGILDQIYRLFAFDGFSKIGILTDTKVGRCWLRIVKEGTGRKEVTEIIVPAGEQTKTIGKVIEVWRKLFEEGFDRHSLLINLGGGVVSDLGGFVAGTFMRGIAFLQIPTSLLAQVDASVGGKTGIDFDGIKNGIGLFSEPIGVIIDPKTLTTLPKQELVASFAEIIKHGVIAKRRYFDFVTSKKPQEFNQEELVRIIEQSIRIKLSIVQKDPKEKGLRKILNFGHTIGHAIESLSLDTKTPFLHGEAVALGMIAESKLAQFLGLLSEKDFRTIENGLINTGLPTKVSNTPTLEIIRITSFDKKNIKGNVLWSLPKKVGEVVFNVEAPENLVTQAIKYVQI